MKAKLLLLIVVAVASALLKLITLSPKSAGAQVVQDKQLTLPILNQLLDPLYMSEGLPTSDSETAELASIFADAERAMDQVSELNLSTRYQVQKAELDELEQFIVSHPDSAWVPSLHANLGKYYFTRKLYTASLDHLSTAWESNQAAQTPNAKHVADVAITFLTRLLVFLGRTPELDVLYASVGDRPLDLGPLSAAWLRTMEKHMRMKRAEYDSYKCGVYAIDRIAEKFIGRGNYSQSELLRTVATPKGFSMLQLQELAAKVGLDLTSVHRVNSGDFVVPSIVHLKADHYTCILDEQNGMFYCVDPSSGPPVWLSAEEINAEASDYFLVPSAEVRAPFAAVDVIASGSVYGRVSTCPPTDGYDALPRIGPGNRWRHGGCWRRRRGWRKSHRSKCGEKRFRRKLGWSRSSPRDRGKRRWRLPNLFARVRWRWEYGFRRRGCRDGKRLHRVLSWHRSNWHAGMAGFRALHKPLAS